MQKSIKKCQKVGKNVKCKETRQGKNNSNNWNNWEHFGTKLGKHAKQVETNLNKHVGNIGKVGTNWKQIEPIRKQWETLINK